MFDWLRQRGRRWNHTREHRVYEELELNLWIKLENASPRGPRGR